MPSTSLLPAFALALFGLAAAPASALEAQVVVTANANEVFQAWEQPSGKTITIVPVGVASRGTFIAALVLFKSCSPDAAGNCNVELDIATYDPYGNVYGEFVGKELWQGKPAPELSQIGVDYMGLEIEPQDPSGTYKVVARARDLNAKSSVTATTHFQVPK